MTTIIIARHGNTFDHGDKVVRVGCKTDMPLSQSGISQAEHIGKYLKFNRIHLAAVFTSTLSRTIQTAKIALREAGISAPVGHSHIFDEIDYGPDEGKTEEEVIKRIGEHAIHDWNTLAIVPPGWIVDTDQIVKNWFTFAKEVLEKYRDKTVMVVTSNGIARFAPYITHHFLSFSEKHQIKLSTGCLASLSYKDDNWVVDFWNEKPK